MAIRTDLKKLPVLQLVLVFLVFTYKVFLESEEK